MKRREPQRGDAWLRVIGVGKLLKSAMFVLLGVALVGLLGNVDRGRRVEHWVGQLRPGLLTHLADAALRRALTLPKGTRVVIVGGAFAYAILFGIEGVGLLLLRRWAEWLTVVSTALLIPFEVYEIVRHPTVVRVGVFALNVAALVYLIVRIRRDVRAHRPGPAATPV